MKHVDDETGWILAYPYQGETRRRRPETHGLDMDTMRAFREDARDEAADRWAEFVDEVRPSAERAMLAWRRRVWQRLYRRGFRLVRFELRAVNP